MDKNFQIELGSQIVLVVAPDADSKLEILKTVIERTNGDMQIVGCGRPDGIGLVAARVGHSILVVDIEGRAENGGIERFRREISIVVAPPDADQLSLYLVPPSGEQIEAVLAPEARNDVLATENAELRAALEAETKRADENAEIAEQFRAKEELEKADVGQTSESEAAAKIVKEPKKGGTKTGDFAK